MSNKNTGGEKRVQNAEKSHRKKASVMLITYETDMKSIALSFNGFLKYFFLLWSVWIMFFSPAPSAQLLKAVKELLLISI